MGHRQPPDPRIRDLTATVYEVYGYLHGRTGSVEKALDRFPGLTREDVVAAEAYVVARIRARTHDEITGRALLSKALLEDGAYYKGRCGNATIARWNAEAQCFYHWREKLGHIYVETIKYPTDEDNPWWDVFFVVEALGQSKFEIPFDQDATFGGDAADLEEFQAEMWSRIKEVSNAYNG